MQEQVTALTSPALSLVGFGPSVLVCKDLESRLHRSTLLPLLPILIHHRALPVYFICEFRVIIPFLNPALALV